MKTRLLIATALAAAAGLAASPATAAHPTSTTSTSVSAVALTAKHSCTHTSSGSCIRGGEFCKQSMYGQAGYDAYGRRYVCKGSRTHPHWMV